MKRVSWLIEQAVLPLWCHRSCRFIDLIHKWLPIHYSFVLVQEVSFISYRFPISLEWGGTTISETVNWFQYEEDPTLNSNVYDVAEKLVQQHFPGEFGSERLVQKVVDIILRQTARKEGENKGLFDNVLVASVLFCCCSFSFDCALKLLLHTWLVVQYP